MSEWLRVAFQQDIVVRGLKVALLIGTILTAINQGDLLLNGMVDSTTAWKVLLTYLVPYCVSTYASVSATLAAAKEQ